ncbi:diguanylate cyclase domain-containing protein [Planomonospora algeriensis]
MHRDPVLLCTFATALALTGFFASGAVDGRTQSIVFWAVQAVFDLLFCVLCWSVGRVAEAPASTRRFWRWTAAAGLVFLIADTVQTLDGVRDPALASTSGGDVQNVLVACGAVVVIVAMLIHPIQAVGRDRLRFALDAATVMAGVAAFIWYFSISVLAAEGQVRVGVILAGPGLMLLCTFTLVKLVLGGDAPFTRAAGIAAGVSTGLFGLGAALGHVTATSEHTHLWLLVRLLPCVLLVATPRLQELQLRGDAYGAVRRDRRRPYSSLPYVAVAAAQALLVVALRDGLTVRTWGVVTGVIVVTSLVLVRQLVAFRDNADLLRRLDRSMLTVRRQEERFRSLVQHSSDITAVVDPSGRFTYASPAVERVLGADPEKITGRPVLTVVHPDDHATVRDAFEGLVGAPGRVRSWEARLRRADGSWRWLAVVATDLTHLPSVDGVVCNARDITEIREFQERLQYAATHDPLTGLANRALFDERLRAASTATVLLIDLDDFKPVNDMFGHHIGDELLIAVAERLRGCVRAGGTVARLGGDEFAVLLPHDPADEDAGPSAAGHGAQVAERVLAAFAEPVRTSGGPLRIKASIGVADGSTSDAAGLLRRADDAMYLAKHGGKNGYAASPAAA